MLVNLTNSIEVAHEESIDPHTLRLWFTVFLDEDGPWTREKADIYARIFQEAPLTKHYYKRMVNILKTLTGPGVSHFPTAFEFGYDGPGTPHLDGETIAKEIKDLLAEIERKLG